MYDIEVIDGYNYAVISEGSATYDFLKAMNSKLVMKKLASEPGEKTTLTVSEVSQLCRGFQRKDLKRLVDVDLIEWVYDRRWIEGTCTFQSYETYSFTEYGLDVMKHIKEFGGDVEIRLN